MHNCLSHFKGEMPSDGFIARRLCCVRAEQEAHCHLVTLYCSINTVVQMEYYLLHKDVCCVFMDLIPKQHLLKCACVSLLDNRCWNTQFGKGKTTFPSQFTSGKHFWSIVWLPCLYFSKQCVYQTIHSSLRLQKHPRVGLHDSVNTVSIAITIWAAIFEHSLTE